MQSRFHLCDIPVVVITTEGPGGRMDDDVTAYPIKPFDLDRLVHLVMDTVGSAIPTSL
jgi:hypothetical protein